MQDSDECWMRLRRDFECARVTKAIVRFGLEVDVDGPDESRSPRLLHARKVAMYLAHTAFGLSLTRVSMAFERDKSTVGSACHKIEDMRDDAEFDAQKSAFSQSISALRDGPFPHSSVQPPPTTSTPTSYASRPTIAAH